VDRATASPVSHDEASASLARSQDRHGGRASTDGQACRPAAPAHR
jgi:hypothetical protein